MKKAVRLFCLSCCAAVVIALLAEDNRSMAQADITDRSVARSSGKLVFIDGDEAEPPAWPEMPELSQRPAPKVAVAAAAAPAPEEKKELQAKKPPRLPGRDTSIARMPSGEVFTIIWAR